MAKQKTDFIVGLSAGHGGDGHSVTCADGGTCAACGTKAGITYDLGTEAEYTRGIVDWVARAMPGRIWFVRLNHERETVGVTTRGDRAVRANCDLVLSLHVNESPSPSSHGAHMFYLPRVNETLPKYVAEHIAMRWPKQLSRGMKSRTTRDGTYVAGMLEPADARLWPDATALLKKYDPIPTVLVEMFYASNENDCREAMSLGVRTQIVAAILSGIGAAYYSTYGRDGQLVG